MKAHGSEGTNWSAQAAGIACFVAALAGFARLAILFTNNHLDLLSLPIGSVVGLCLAIAIVGRLRGQDQGIRFGFLLPVLAPGAYTLVEYYRGSPFDLEMAWSAILIVATASAAHPSRKAGTFAVLLAGVSIAIAAFSVGSLLIYDQGRDVGNSLTGPVAAIGIATAILAWRPESGWSDSIASDIAGRSIIARIFPVVLALPVVFAVAGMWADRRWPSVRLAESLGVSILNVLLLTAVLIWEAGRLSRKRARLGHLGKAIDSAAIILADADGRVRLWSGGCGDMYGWNEEHAFGRNKYELAQSMQIGGGRPATPEVGVRELVERRQDGTLLRVLEDVRALDGEPGGPAFILSMTDITARADAEAALGETESRLALALEAHDVGIFEWDVPSGRIQWSPGSEQRLGFPSGSLDSFENWARYVEPTDSSAVDATIAEATKTRADSFGFFYRLRSPAGTVRSIEGSSRCFYDETGQLLRTVGVAIDVTQQAEREASLHAREVELRAILETVTDAMVVIDERGAIRSFSATAARLFGYTPDEIIGRNVALLTPGEVAPHHDGYIRRYLEGGLPRIIGKSRVLTAERKDGSQFPIELHVGEGRIGDARIFVGFIRDLSERLANEDRLALLQGDLAHLSRLGAMGEMASGLAHELNQPLTAVTNFLAAAEAVLEQGDVHPQVRELLSMGQGQALRAGEIIRRMRDFVEKREVEMRVESVADALAEATSLVLVGSGQFDIKVLSDVASDARFMFADRVQIQQVVVNLLRNSVDAMRAAASLLKEITISVRAVPGEMIEITVADTGPGISACVLGQLYDPFVSTKGEGGMGVGLSICRRIVEAHGGQLWGENGETGGAIFRLTVPRVEREEEGA